MAETIKIPVSNTPKEKLFSENLYFKRDKKDQEFAKKIDEYIKGDNVDKLGDLLGNLNEAIKNTKEKIASLAGREQEKGDSNLGVELNWEKKRAEVLEKMLTVIQGKIKGIKAVEATTKAEKLNLKKIIEAYTPEQEQIAMAQSEAQARENETQAKAQVKEVDPQWGKDAQNKIAKEIVKENSATYTVQKGETLGAIMKGLTGKLNWGMEVDYRSSKLSKNKPTKLADANKIYPGQKVWIEGKKIIVADEVAVPQSLEKKELPELKKEEKKELPELKKEEKKELPAEKPEEKVSPAEKEKIERYNKLVDVVNELAPKVRILAREKGMNVEDNEKNWKKARGISLVNTHSPKLENYVKHLGEFQANLTQMPDKVLEAGVVTGKIGTPPAVVKESSVQGEVKESPVEKSEEQTKQDIQKLLEEMDVPPTDWIDIKNLPKADWDRIGKKYAKGGPTWEVKLKWKLGNRDLEDAAKWINTTNGKRFLASLEKDLEEWVKAGRYNETAGIVSKRIGTPPTVAEVLKTQEKVEATEDLATELGAGKELLKTLVVKAEKLQYAKGPIPEQLAARMQEISNKLKASTKVTLEEAKKMNKAMKNYIETIDKLLQS